MADGLKERIKKLLRPVYEFRPGFGMGPGRGGSFMSQEDYSNKYRHLMPGFSWSNSKPHPDELDTPANRAKLENELVEQEIGDAYRMAQSISSKELKALYGQGRGAKHQIDTGNTFSIEYDKHGTPTHVKLDFGGGVEWRSRIGFMSDAISQRERALATEQQDRRDQIRSTVFSPVLAKLRDAKTVDNAEIYDFLSRVEVASARSSENKQQSEPVPQEIRQVNVLKSHYISRDGNRTFENLADHPAALRGHPEDTGVSAGLTQLAAIRDVLRAEPEATVNSQSAALGQRGTSYNLTVDEMQLVQSSIVAEWDEDLETHIEQPHDRVYDVENLKEILTDQQGVEWKEIDALADGFEPDPDQTALRLEVVERLREVEIDSLNFEDEGVSFHLDGDKLVETWTNPDQSFAWDADKCDLPLYATDVQLTTDQVAQNAPYELTEQDQMDRAEAENMAMEEKEQVQSSVEFTEDERQVLAEEQYEENGQHPTIEEEIHLANASAGDGERRAKELEMTNQLAHLRMPDGGTFVQHVQQRHEQGHESTMLGGYEYRMDGNEIVSRHGSEELRADAGMVDHWIASRHQEADQFSESLKPAPDQTVSAIETPNQSEVLKTQKTNDNQALTVKADDQEAEAHHRPHSMDDIGTRALKKLEASGQQLRPEVADLMKQITEAQSQSQSQRQGQGQRI